MRGIQADHGRFIQSGATGERSLCCTELLESRNVNEDGEHTVVPGNRGPRRPDGRDESDAEAPRERAGPAVEGTVREVLPNALYGVELPGGQKILAHIGTSLQTRIVRVLPGDRVTVQLSPYDRSRGRITQRHR